MTWRVALAFVREEAAKYISHLDLARAWERALRRAGLPVAYSAGFHPQPRVAFAAPLPVGATGAEEFVEIHFTEALELHRLIDELGRQLLPGLRLLRAWEEEPSQPSLQSRVRGLEWRIDFDAPVPGLERAAARFLEQSEVPYERRREGKTKRLNLRSSVADLAAVEEGGAARLLLKVRTEAGGATRPDELLEVLGVRQRRWRLHRARVELE